MKKILVLGGANGFLGKNLVDFYCQDPTNEVFATVYENLLEVNERCQYLRCDLTKRFDIKHLFESVKPEIVIHAAAYTTSSKDVMEAPFKHVTDNVCMNALVFEACHINKVKNCVFFSCSVPYQSKETPQKESDWKIQDELYPAYFGVGSMKVYSERLCEFYSRLGNTKFTVLRLSNVIGPGDKTDPNKVHVFGAQCLKVLNAMDSIEVWGDKNNQAKRDLIYVDDVIDMVDRTVKLQGIPYDLFNCGSGTARSIEEIIETIKKVAGKENLKLIWNNSKPSIPTTVILDCRKAKEKLGWEPRTLFVDAVEKALSYYKNNG